MPSWMKHWRSLVLGLTLFALLALGLGALAARFVHQADHARPSNLVWMEICTDSGNRWVLVDLSTP